MEKKFDINTDNVVVKKGTGWSDVTAINFGGANVIFSGVNGNTSPFSGNTTITSVTNGNITRTNCNYLFYKDRSLVEFNCNLKDTTEGRSMFNSCSSLTTFNSTLDNLQNGRVMFGYCYALTKFNIDMPRLTNGEYMFTTCSSLTQFNSSLPSLISGDSMFEGCKALTSFTTDMPSLLSGNYMFSGCSSLLNVDFRADNAKIASRMFEMCTSLQHLEIDLPAENNGINCLCNGCGKLESARISIPSVVDKIYIPFNGCSNLTDLYLYAPNAKSFYRLGSGERCIFENCGKLSNVYIDMRSITNISYTFTGNNTSLSNVTLIVNESQSGTVQSDYSIPSTAPCQAHRYVDVLGDGTVRLVFTNKSYRTIDHAPYIMTAGGEYHLTGVAEQVIVGTSHEDAEYTVTFVNDNDYPVTIHGNNTDTTGETLTIEPNQTWTGTVYVFWTRFGDGWFLGFTPAE